MLRQQKVVKSRSVKIQICLLHALPNFVLAPNWRRLIEKENLKASISELCCGTFFHWGNLKMLRCFYNNCRWNNFFRVWKHFWFPLTQLSQPSRSLWSKKSIKWLKFLIKFILLVFVRSPKLELWSWECCFLSSNR